MTSMMTSEQLPLLVREPETLEGYTPVFSRAECLLGLKSERRQVGRCGLGSSLYEDRAYEEPEYETHHYITILGLRIDGAGAGPFNCTYLDIAATIANSFLANKENATRHPEVWDFLAKNGRDLSNSKRYWAAVDHLAEVKAEEQKIEELKERVRRGYMVASLKAYEVKLNRRLTNQELDQAWAEFSGGLPRN